ncbi:hypothetical protein PAHAL_4G174400 [Panicum hallii]|uniref:Uncharacterized protein n=1 Tax=Panicum hallii TaxID=206008 RepID=A0A2T8JD70_9POAL|nr:hypothetical protein PAHAL_4G174400 [Panicum hallii]
MDRKAAERGVEDLAAGFLLPVRLQSFRREYVGDARAAGWRPHCRRRRTGGRSLRSIRRSRTPTLRLRSHVDDRQDQDSRRAVTSDSRTPRRPITSTAKKTRTQGK